MEAGGQTISSGTSAYSSLFGGASSGGSLMGDDMVGSLLGSLFGGDSSGLGSLLGGTTGLDSLFGRGLDADSAVEYLTDNRFDPTALIWSSNGGGYTMHLTEE